MDASQVFQVLELYNKRDFTIEKQQMSFILPFYTTQKYNPYLNSRISDNRDKEGLSSQYGEILKKGFVYLL